MTESSRVHRFRVNSIHGEDGGDIDIVGSLSKDVS